jgi:hypothetical protein
MKPTDGESKSLPVNTSRDVIQSLAPQLAPHTENDTILARLIKAWPSLPERKRQAMLAILDS